MVAPKLLILLTIIIGLNSQILESYTKKKCEDYGIGKKEAYSLDFCRSTLYDCDDCFQCCYMKYEMNGVTHHTCQNVTIDKFYDIDGTIKALEDGYKLSHLVDVNIKELVCDSCTYLYISLTILLLLLF